VDAARWQRIEAILAEVFELDEDARSRYLATACAGDPLLRRDVDALLASDADAGGVLDGGLAAPLLGAIAVEREHAEALPTGAVVGPYRVIERLGRGGMGEVYLAARTLGDFEQRVALKLIKRGMDTDEVLRRFLAERRVLARLEHPFIVRLIDAGASDDGRPYFAMEYVDGVPLTAWAQQRQLGLRERLRLFLGVAAAVDHAHRQLVVHRDLKPSNILVRDDGRVALLDFGIAKWLQSDADDAHATAAGAQALTPEFAAPELLRGDAATVATDVYGLGAVLYHLLTGVPPRHVASRDPAVLAAALAPAEPQPPSRVGGGRGLRAHDRSVAADLDTIVLKALRDAPAERYASVAAFADDVRRLLESRPILARPQRAGYRLRRFVARHRVAVVLGGALAASLLIGLGTAAWQARLVVREAERTAQIKQFVLELFESTDPETSAGPTLTVRDMLDRGVARARTELAASPDILADVLLTLGRLYEQNGLFNAAAPVIDESLALRRVHGTPAAVAEALHARGVVAHWRKRYDEARAAYDEALALRRTALGDAHAHTALTASLLGRLLFDRGDSRLARNHLSSAASVLARAGPAYARDAAGAWNTLGRIAQADGELDRAEGHYRRSLALRERALGGAHPAVAESLLNLGTLAEARARFDEAASLFERARALRVGARGALHASVGVVENNLGELRLVLGRYDQAEAHLRRALEMKRAAFGEAAPQLAVAWHNLARVALARGDVDAAERWSASALQGATQLFGERHVNVAAVRLVRAELAARRGHHDEARTVLTEADAALRAAFAPGHARLAELDLVASRVALARGDALGAQAAAREALAARRARFGADDWRTAEAMLRLAEALAESGSDTDAIGLARQARTVLARTLGPEHPLALAAAGVEAGAVEHAREAERRER
jgi:serine/threonine-protein kinase